jgi:16S rRNA A1518/A1519 N6-dimethyltransferase RsmA/KsgA/DIM1 with predicted DNA glycosylase/AP lyase activity
MNNEHAVLCSSPERAQHLQIDVLTPMLTGLHLGDRLIEVGSGPGAATEWLRHRVAHLAAIEADPATSANLQARYRGTNVAVRCAGATDLPLPQATFAIAASFTMLHHVPTPTQQRAS